MQKNGQILHINTTHANLLKWKMQKDRMNYRIEWEFKEIKEIEFLKRSGYFEKLTGYEYLVLSGSLFR